MRTLLVLLPVLALLLVAPRFARADSRGDDLAAWLDESGKDAWGEAAEPCDDLTFARRVYLDLLGRVPGVSELRDFQALGGQRRKILVDQLVFAEGSRAVDYERLQAQHLAKQWRRILLPPGTTATGSSEALEAWLFDKFKQRVPYDELMGQLARVQSNESSGGYYQLLGSLPENYAGHVSRVMLGVRIECAQCHDHPFTDWKQRDFWGLAAFYSDLSRPGDNPDASAATKQNGSIEYEGVTYPAKLLWTDQAVGGGATASRSQLARWLTAKENPQFAATAVNRVWQLYVGQGIYPDVENLDTASSQERELLDELGQRFADEGFNLQVLIAGICKSSWYQAVSADAAAREAGFARTLKVLSPEQVFDSLEQSLLLPVSRIDPNSPRWSGDRMQLVSRLSETVGATPEDYAAGIPQALLLMNGKMTSDAIEPARSRLLRAVNDSPFFDDSERVKTLYLAVLTREPSSDEAEALLHYLDSKSDEAARQHAFGEILWALLNSPEFVLCR